MVTREFVDRWLAEYPPGSDDVVLNEVGPQVRAAGEYDLEALLAVGRWKSSRSSAYLKRNDDSVVRYVSRMAFGAPDSIKHRVLDLLDGVGIPMASALLTVWNPEEFTVIDVRALATLRTAGELEASKHNPPYRTYVEVCRTIADRCGCDLRTLDRALWAAKGQVD